jgi:hypothetical protein
MNAASCTVRRSAATASDTGTRCVSRQILLTSNDIGANRNSRLSSDLADGLTQFMRDHVSSYEELEVLLFLARQPSRSWSDAEVASSLNVGVDSITTALERLLALGTVIEAEPGPRANRYRFAPANQLIRDRVAELQLAYAEQRFAVVQAMTANAMQRVRSSAAHTLANAFRFERSKK